MKERGFDQGVRPGGLYYDTDIKILICYMLFSVKSGLSKDDIMSVIQDNRLANYFEASNAFSELIKENHIMCSSDDDNLYINTLSGDIIADQLGTTLPLTVRQMAVKASLNALIKAKNEKDNHVKITKVDDGYKVSCTINDINIELMSFSITVADMLQAETVKDNFLKNPGIFYKNLLALATGEKSFLE